MTGAAAASSPAARDAGHDLLLPAPSKALAAMPGSTALQSKRSMNLILPALGLFGTLIWCAVALSAPLWSYAKTLTPNPNS